VDKWVAFKTQFMAPTTGIMIEETASTVIGGCVNASDRFIDGFYWVTVLCIAAARGAAQINRQDLAGWSFLGRPSHYELVGPPGWLNGSAALVPHPDYYTTVLFKQVMGGRVLNTSLSGAGAATATAHVFCAAPAAGAPPGAVSVAFVNAAADAAGLTVPSLSVLAPRAEFLLTATAKGLGGRGGSGQLPAELWDDAIFLNGALMSVDAGGNLPAVPIPGNNVPAGSAEPITLPPYSYGFFVFPAAGAAACI
jgi:heparanase 1